MATDFTPPRPTDRSMRPYVRSVNHIRPDQLGNVNIAEGTPDDGDTYIYNSVTNLFEYGTPVQFKNDQFTVIDDATDTFVLSHAPMLESWNVDMGWPWTDGLEYSISGNTLTVLDPADSFRGIADNGPRILQVEYAYRTNGSVDTVDSWSIAGNKAVSNATTLVPYLDVGSVVTEVFATIGGDLTDIGVGMHKSTGNYVTAQYDEVGTSQVRILATRAGADESLGGGIAVQANASLAAGDIVKLTANWSTGLVTMYVNGVSVLSGTATAAQLAAWASPTAVHFRKGVALGSTFDDLTVNGVLADDFNRADDGALGTASSGNVWAQE